MSLTVARLQQILDGEPEDTEVHFCVDTVKTDAGSTWSLGSVLEVSSGTVSGKGGTKRIVFIKFK